VLEGFILITRNTAISSTSISTRHPDYLPADSSSGVIGAMQNQPSGTTIVHSSYM
jgi:hypothetical protein